MNANYYRLLVVLTIKHPQEAQDIIMRATRTLPFQPAENTTLVMTNNEDDQYELLLGAPRYEFDESSFVEYQEDESLLEYMREGNYSPANRDSLIKYYESFGFAEVKPRVVIEQRTRVQETEDEPA